MILFMIIFVQSDNSKYLLIEFSIELHTIDNITINYPRSVGCRSGGVGHGPRDQFCPITSLQMAD